jgi:hypothetical protein
VPEGHGDAVDLGRKGFGDEGEFHACGRVSSCVLGYAIANPSRSVPITMP